MASARESIRDNLKATIKAVDGVHDVSSDLETWTQVGSSRMPHCMVIPADETRQRVDCNRRTQGHWLIDVWFYLRPTDDVETWIEKIRAAIMVDRGRGGYALDTFIETIECDDLGLAIPNKFFRFSVGVDYRVTE